MLSESQGCASSGASDTETETAPSATRPRKSDPTEVRITDPVSGGQKGAKREQFGLVPVFAMEELARVYGFGASKYSAGNWIKGYRWSLSIDALFRHIFAFLRGESKDPESGFHHLAHAAFHLFAMMEWERRGVGTDDRLFKQP